MSSVGSRTSPALPTNEAVVPPQQPLMNGPTSDTGKQADVGMSSLKSMAQQAIDRAGLEQVNSSLRAVQPVKTAFFFLPIKIVATPGRVGVNQTKHGQVRSAHTTIARSGSAGHRTAPEGTPNTVPDDGGCILPYATSVGFRTAEAVLA